MKLWAALALAILAIAAYGIAFVFPSGAAAILIVLSCIFSFSRLNSPRQVFYGGLVLGVGIYAPHLSFFIHVFGRPVVLLFAIAGLPIAIFLLMSHLVRERFGAAALFWLTPMLWTGIEFFRSELYQLRFAWLLPGEAAVFLPGVRWLWVGVYGVGFLYAVAGAMVVSPWRGVRWAGVFVSIGLAVLVYWPVNPAVDSHAPLHVAGVQLESSDAPAVDRLASAHPEAQILVLSEYTFQSEIPAEVRALMRKHHRYLIAGGVRRVDENRFYDTTFVVGPDGKDVFSQAKSVPVQFMLDGLRPITERFGIRRGARSGSRSVTTSAMRGGWTILCGRVRAD